MNLWQLIREHPGFALAGVGVLLGILVRVLYWIVCGLQALSDAADRSFVFPPFRVRLEPAEHRQWTEDPPVQTVRSALQQLGFTDGGAFRIWEMPDTKLMFLAQPETSVEAVVYRMGDKVWMDVKVWLADGSSITVTNAAMGASLQPRPGHRTLRQPEANPQQLYERLQAECSSQPRRPVAVESLAQQFQEDYAAHADWQAERGGCTAEEIQGEVVASGARKLDTSTLAYFRERHAANALSNWWRSQPNPPYPWEEVKDHLVIIHDELPLDRVEDLYTDQDYELSRKDIPGHVSSAREAFASLNANPKGLRPFTKVWEKTTPLAADFYLAFGEAEEEQEQEAA